jgi:hypothetical protein
MKKVFALLLLSAVFWSACNLPGTLAPSPTPQSAAPVGQPLTSTASPLPLTLSPTPPTPTPVDPQQVVLERASQVVQALRDQDMLALAGYVHPGMGVRFSPYAYVQDSNLVFFASQIAGLLSDPTVYHWGIYDGSGMDINLTFSEYYAEFVYDVDFASAPQVGINQRIGMGNSLDNSLEYYPGAIMIEYHYPGFDPGYQGMDWRSLRLVFQSYADEWYLVGIIHDEWTT